MRWLIASDLHGCAPACQDIVRAFSQEKADRILLLGDLLYHGPRNGVPEGYAPQEVIEMLSALKEKIFCVRGNCEAEVDQMVLPFPVLADYCLLESGGRMIFATHGHIYNMENPPALPADGVLLHGHTHVPAQVQSPEGWWYMNPGSAALPKAGSARGYMILEDGVFRQKELPM